jgi:hypothetical protein
MSLKPFLLLSAALATLTLAACDQKPDPRAAAPQPGAEVAETAPPDETLAPEPEDLPPAPPAPLAPAAQTASSGDRYWSEASQVDDRYDEAPPEYGYDYEGGEPQAWTEGGRILRVLERLSNGGERWYYYRDGADDPYFIRDPDYGYGYDRGRLVVVYDRQGRRLDRALFQDRQVYAGRYLARSNALRAAAATAEKRKVRLQAWRRAEDRADDARNKAALEEARNAREGDRDRPGSDLTPPLRKDQKPDTTAKAERDARAERKAAARARAEEGAKAPTVPAKSIPAAGPAEPSNPRVADKAAKQARQEKKAADRAKATATATATATTPPAAASAAAPTKTADAAAREKAKAERKAARAAKQAATAPAPHT